MLRKDKKTRLGGNAGASLVFVLAVMALLMAISASVLAAAAAGNGARINRKIVSQLNMYADSMQSTIRHSLRSGGDDIDKDIGAAATLGGQLLAVAYSSAPITTLKLQLDAAIAETPELADMVELTIELSQKESTPFVVITPEVPFQEEVLDDDGNVIFPEIPWEPEKASINGRAAVTVTASYEERTVISVTEYDLSGGYLEQESEGSLVMLIKAAGEWRALSHEKVDIEAE